MSHQKPLPVEVVRSPKGPGFKRRFIEAIPTAIVTSLLTAFVLGLLAPNIAKYVSLFRPTCAQPEGLREIPHGDMAKVEAPRDPKGSPPDVLLDGRVASVWVPPLLPATERPDWMSHKPEFGVVDTEVPPLTIRLAESEDVQLVCVVNGLANSYPNYVNWSRVRSVRVWTDTNDNPELSVLASLDEGSFQSFQDVRTPRGEASEVKLQVLDLYEGQQIVSADPDVCGTRLSVGEGRENDPVGCNLNAAPQGGLAEIKVYALDEPRWHTLFSFLPLI